MDQKTGKAVLDDDGNEITASKVITAAESSGSVEIEFHFAGVSLAGKTIVAFENLEYEGKLYAVHADLNDESQTIYFPSVKTKAVDKNTGLNQVKEDSNVTVVDTVTYTGLQPGKTYTMTGMLMSSAGNAIVSNGRRITASTEFTPTESDGSVDVVFNFDATNGFGGRQYVFFEYLYLDGVRVAAHTDISDTNQIIYIPSIKTTLIDSENGSHSSAADQDITLIDTMKSLDSDKKTAKPVEEAPKAEEKVDFSNVKIEPIFKEMVDFETFAKSDFRAVKILACEAVPKSKKLLKFTLDDGERKDRVILSGIHEYYEPEELVGKTAIAIVNLPPRKMMGIASEGMLISAVHEEDGHEGLNLLMVNNRIPAGAKLY